MSKKDREKKIEAAGAQPALPQTSPAEVAKSEVPVEAPVAQPAPVIVEPAPTPPEGYAADPLGHAEELEREGMVAEGAEIREAEGLPALSAAELEELDAGYKFRRQIDELLGQDPGFRVKFGELSKKYEAAFYEEVRGLIASLGSRQQIVKPTSRYKVLAEAKVGIAGGVKTLKVGDILTAERLGTRTIEALLAEPKVKLEKLPD